MDTTDVLCENSFTKAFGSPSERAAGKVKDRLSEGVKEFIRESPFLVMATSGAGGSCDASPKGGKPGFVRILDDQHLLVPDVAGNKLFQSYLNMEQNPQVGLVFFIPGVTDVVRVNGWVSIVPREELDRQRVEESMSNPDGDRGVQQGIVVKVQEAYSHCPRALTYSDLWNVETIQRRGVAAHSVRMAPASGGKGR
jgi:PPOX class probable FMN-dependent enzyme